MINPAMIDVALVLVLALSLDLLLGDPRRWHPVVGIGKIAEIFADWFRRGFGETSPGLRLSGAITALCTVVFCATVAGSIAFAIQWQAHSLVTVCVCGLLISFMIAARSLESHILAVFTALRSQDLQTARERTSWIVGRDTAQLPENELVRATVECAAESISDGVTGPLFFAALGGWLAGPPGAVIGAVAYRSINTMDSMFGYRNARYLHFGWAPARLDDLVNLLPARLTIPAIVLAAWVAHESPLRAIWIWWRDALKHTSPNAGQGEAAFAGALKIQLGGTNLYDGVPVIKPVIGIGTGRETDPLHRGHIIRAVRLMILTVLWFTIGISAAILVL